MLQYILFEIYGGIFMKALLVIDMQNVFLGKGHSKYFKYKDNELLASANKVIENNSNNLIVYIRNITKKNLASIFIPFRAYANTQRADLVQGLNVVSDHKFDKYEGDAFSNEDFKEFLTSHKVDTVEIIGIDGGGCVSLTALGAIKNGFKVIMNTTAIGTMLIKNELKLFKKLKSQGAEFI